ncbi:BON domain-containing protein [Amycolatopsis sp. 195334CR]|uniref:BON domain-containing protein n=1 Tax=Amycolatopsis sp. 195334CR TaxID=2814588 RepID=UPI001A8F569C|nr:BON domain-containing protein [Amycolatopsis sp. 195334CR]MBN6041346.1 BON domain-containing protein [Amycolatopsis sp. 195334CR]
MNTEDVPQYSAARLRRALAEDERTTELGVRVDIRADHVHLSGEVACEARRAELEQVVHEHAPNLRVHNDLRVSAVGEPASREELR